MKTLHLYLLRAVLATLGMTVFVFTLVLMLGNVIKEILILVINRQATLGLAAHAILLLIPYVLAFSLPMAMLTTALLVFGRFSADQELTAARAGGISLVSLITPVLGLSVVLSGLCAWLNFEVAPASRVAYKELLYRAGLRRPGGFLQSHQYNSFGKYTIFVGQVAGDGTNLEDVRLSEWGKSGELVGWAKAPRGELLIGATNVMLFLHDGSSAVLEKDGWTPTAAGDFPLSSGRPDAPPTNALPIPISDMTFGQLLAERSRLESGAPFVPRPGASAAEILKEERAVRTTLEEMRTSVLVYLNQQVSFSFACIGFTLIGIPLGIRAHRRETSIGVAAALGLVLVYYAFIVLGDAWQTHAERAPNLVVWLPNFIFQAAGGVLLWRSNNKVC